MEWRAIDIWTTAAAFFAGLALGGAIGLARGHADGHVDACAATCATHATYAIRADGACVCVDP